MFDEIEWVEGFRKLELKENDVVVFKYPMKITSEMYQRIKDMWKLSVAGTSLRNNKLIIVEEGCDIGVIRKE